MTRRFRNALAGAFALLAVPACGAGAAPLHRAQAVDRALANSPEAAADRAATREAARLVDVAGSYQHHPRLAVESAGDGFGPVGADNFTLRLGVTQEFDVHGQRGARREVASAEAGLVEAETMGTTHSLGRRAELAFGMLLVEKRRVGLADSMAATSGRVVAAARRAAQRETISPYSLRQLELDDSRLRGMAARARAARADAEAALRGLLLAAPDETFEPVDDLDGGPWRLPADSLVEVALTVRHDVLEARARENLRSAETDLAAREGRPGPEVELFIEHDRDFFAGDELGGAPTDEGGAGATHGKTLVGAGLSLPLFFSQPQAWAGGRSAIEESRARAARVGLEARVPIEVRAACDRLATAQERAALLDDALVNVDRDLALLESAYREGRIDLDTYLAQRNRFLEAAAAALDARADIEEARSALAQATGLSHASLATALGGDR